jgi:hypothetical protein
MSASLCARAFRRREPKKMRGHGHPGWLHFSWFRCGASPDEVTIGHDGIPLGSYNHANCSRKCHFEVFEFHARRR